MFESPALGSPHRWIYRGQILPASRLVDDPGGDHGRDDDRRRIKADGFLLVDGKVIYQMNDFTLRVNRDRRVDGHSGIRRD